MQNVQKCASQMFLALFKNVHLSWDCLFLFWGDANGKFTYIPKYKPEISETGLY